MNRDELLTIGNLVDFENRINRKLELLSLPLTESKKSGTPNYLRSNGARELLKVSENKLRSMRDNGEIPFTFIGGTYYYPEAEIIKILEENTINKI